MDFSIFSMFGYTGALTKRGPHRPENVLQQHNFFWLWAFSRSVATFKCLVGAAQRPLASVDPSRPEDD